VARHRVAQSAWACTTAGKPSRGKALEFGLSVSALQRWIFWSVGQPQSDRKLPAELKTPTIDGIWFLTLPNRLTFSLLMRFTLSYGLLMIALVCVSQGQSQEDRAGFPYLTQLEDDPSYSDVSDVPNVHLDLRYASENNFLGKNLYREFRRCFLQRTAAEKFRQAARDLAKIMPGWKLLVFDCLRPRSLQQKLFAAVEGTSRQPYVANPRGGSIHNYGLAVDLSLEDQHGHEVDMGTQFDDFTTLAQPAQERESLASGKLSPEQLEHRLLLRKVMTGAGFIQLPIEWWHYDALPKAQVRKNFKIVE
jgi:D-alanyl-D-alanine dipeptidase